MQTLTLTLAFLVFVGISLCAVHLAAVPLSAAWAKSVLQQASR